MHALRAMVPYLAHVPKCFCASRASWILRALVINVARALRAFMPHVPRALRARVPPIPFALRALVSKVPRVSRASYPTCSYAYCASLVSGVSCQTNFCPSHI